MGGTELMGVRINTLPSTLLNYFQIIHSRVREPLDPNKIKILVLHDLALDPENEHLKNGGWNKFDKLVFVSHWQQEQYNIFLGVPYHVGIVLKNAIEPFEIKDINRDPNNINLIYFSTPHRGLNILSYVFDQISKEYDDVFLNVYSSFDLYGWDERDKHYENLFEDLKSNPKVSYNKSVSNQEIRKILLENDILAFPSIWAETSCLVLIEAMCAGLECVHPNFAALTETSLGLTNSYQFNEILHDHANIFKQQLISVIESVKLKKQNGIYNKDKHNFINSKYSWSNRSQEWITLLESLIGKSNGKVFN